MSVSITVQVIAAVPPIMEIGKLVIRNIYHIHVLHEISQYVLTLSCVSWGRVGNCSLTPPLDWLSKPRVPRREILTVPASNISGMSDQKVRK